MKKLSLSLSHALPQGDFADTRVINLCPSRQNPKLLRPVDTPRVRMNYTGQPVTLHSSPDGTMTLFTVTGGLLTANNATKAPSHLCEIAFDDIISTASIGDSVIFMRRDDTPLEVIRTDGEWSVISSRPLPIVTFSTDSNVTLTGRSSARTLSGGYTHWSGPLSTTDRDLLSADLRDLYNQISDRARLAGRYIQPIALWWRLVDNFGRVFHRSLPIIVGPDGVQASDPLSATVTLESSTWSKLSGFKMELNSFRPIVSIEPSLWHDFKIEVLATPPIDLILVQSDDPSPDFVFGPSSTSEATLIATLPTAGVVTTMAALLDRLDTLSTVVATIGCDTDKTQTVTLQPARTSSAIDERAGLWRAVATEVSANQSLLRRCCLPHSFSAASSHASGDTVVWGDITPIAAPPSLPSHMAVAHGVSDEWAEVALLTDSDAGTLADSDSSTSPMPSLLSPLICYPSPTARQLSLQLSAASLDGRRRIVYQLATTPASRWAFALADERLRPVSPGDWPAADDPLQPATARSASRAPGSILIADTKTPLTPLSTITSSDGEIKAITTASRSSSAWDFARRHFYIFSSGGISGLSVSRTACTISINRLSSVGVQSASLVAPTSAGVIAYCTDGVLRRVTGSSVSTFSSTSSVISALCWSAATSQLWALTSDDLPVTVFADATPANFQRSDISPDSLISDGHQLFLTTKGSLSEVVAGAPAAFTYVSLKLRYPATMRMALRRVAWHFTAAMPSLTLEVRGDNGDASRSQRIISLLTSGPVRAQITAATPYALPYANITLHLYGTVTPDALFAPPSIDLKAVA